MNLYDDALETLKKTSRTFYIPISRLPPGLQEAVASAYLCMRAIDEIEDSPILANATKVELLHQFSLTLQAATEQYSLREFEAGWAELVERIDPEDSTLPEVSLRIGEWAMLAPATIAPRIWDATAAMADRMAYWAQHNWTIKTEADLDRYTFGVAGAVGLLLSDLWAWYDSTSTNRAYAIGFGRGLQAVNILRNHRDDKARGVDFFPDDWSIQQMRQYAHRNLMLANAYTSALPKGPALDFCRIPLALAHATLDVLGKGEDKLSRSVVMDVVEQVTKGFAQHNVS